DRRLLDYRNNLVVFIAAVLPDLALLRIVVYAASRDAHRIAMPVLPVVALHDQYAPLWIQGQREPAVLIGDRALDAVAGRSAFETAAPFVNADYDDSWYRLFSIVIDHLTTVH